MRRFIAALFAVAATIIAPNASSEEAHHPPASEVITEQLRLTTRSPMGERLFPPNRRLGTFAVDLGLSLDGSFEEQQQNRFMSTVFARVASHLATIKSNQRCRLVLSSAAIPYFEGFLYKENSDDPSGDARAACMSIVRDVLDHEIGSNIPLIARTMREWIEDRRRDRKNTGDVNFAREHAILAVERSSYEATRRIYDPHSLMHALLSVGVDRLAQLRADDFRQWLRRVREHAPLRMFSEDPQMWPILGVTTADQMPLLPPLPAPKTRERVIKMPDIDTPAIRAAVLLAIDPSQYARVREEVTRKYCAFLNSTPTAEFRARCDSENHFGRETWITLYFDASHGPDHVLLDRVNQIASDPIVCEVAARRQNGETRGHPYVVLFGSLAN